jgi:hypothetical protein
MLGGSARVAPEPPPVAADRRTSRLGSAPPDEQLTQEALLLDLWISLAQVQAMDEASDLFAQFSRLALPNLEQSVTYVIDGDWLRACGGRGDSLRTPLDGLVGQAILLNATLNIPPAEDGLCTLIFPIFGKVPDPTPEAATSRSASPNPAAGSESTQPGGDFDLLGRMAMASLQGDEGSMRLSNRSRAEAGGGEASHSGTASGRPSRPGSRFETAASTSSASPAAAHGPDAAQAHGPAIGALMLTRFVETCGQSTPQSSRSGWQPGGSAASPRVPGAGSVMRHSVLGFSPEEQQLLEHAVVHLQLAMQRALEFEAEQQLLCASRPPTSLPRLP